MALCNGSLASTGSLITPRSSCSRRSLAQPIRSSLMPNPPAIFEEYEPACTCMCKQMCSGVHPSYETLAEKVTAGSTLQFVVLSRLASEHNTTSVLLSHLDEHERWLRGLGDRVQFHGPFINAQASYSGSEMYAVLADSAAEARQLVEQDPVHKNGIRQFEVLSWVQKPTL